MAHLIAYDIDIEPLLKATKNLRELLPFVDSNTLRAAPPNLG